MHSLKKTMRCGCTVWSVLVTLLRQFCYQHRHKKQCFRYQLYSLSDSLVSCDLTYKWSKWQWGSKILNLRGKRCWNRKSQLGASVAWHAVETSESLVSRPLNLDSLHQVVFWMKKPGEVRVVDVGCSCLKFGVGDPFYNSICHFKSQYQYTYILWYNQPFRKSFKKLLMDKITRPGCLFRRRIQQLISTTWSASHLWSSQFRSTVSISSALNLFVFLYFECQPVTIHILMNWYITW